MIMTLKNELSMKTKLTTKEEKTLLKGICPDCGTKKFLEGPHGGVSVNIMCDKCKSEFNICPGLFAERINVNKSMTLNIKVKETTRFELIDLD